MISKETVQKAAQKACELSRQTGDESLIVAKVTVNKANNIAIYLDRLTGVTIEDCSSVSKAFETLVDREIEDYSLTVSSLGCN
ncbi:MAG: hypothetical protein LBO06_07960 [Bacteroidales bacterium]|jgi:ribosome maturation factor RimP|nr:hypothetical protein [Bacteroidales bacterium]